jgi:predicted RNA-binding Zn-ribbon protein involved in translation (DUF1610 family)
MQKLQFLATLRDYDRIIQRRMLLGAAGFFMLVVPTAAWLVIHGPVAAGVSVYAGVLLLSGGMSYLHGRRMRPLATKMRLTCPSCGKPFFGWEFWDLGYTETCESCGARVFGDEDLSSTPACDEARLSASAGLAHRTKKLKFLASIQRFRRTSKTRVLRSFLIFLAAIGVTVVVGVLRLRDQIGERSACVITAAVLISGLIGVISYAVVATRRARRRMSLYCPSCDRVFWLLELRDLGYTETCPACDTSVFE